MFAKTKKRLFINVSVLAMMLVLVMILATTALAGGKGPVVHMVSVGGPDVCASVGLNPGCDKNFSLNASEYADGSVSGEWTDQLGGGNGGFHAAIDCLVVDGNEAWVGGVIKTSTDTTGLYPVDERVVARVMDNGISANDPVDQISFSYPESGLGVGCDFKPDIDLSDAPQGQVVVK